MHRAQFITFVPCVVDLKYASNVVLFYCKHAYHEDCLPTHAQVRNNSNIFWLFLTRRSLIFFSKYNGITYLVYTCSKHYFHFIGANANFQLVTQVKPLFLTKLKNFYVEFIMVCMVQCSRLDIRLS